MIRVAAKLVLIFILVYVGVNIWYSRLEESFLTVSAPVAAPEPVEPEKKVEIVRTPEDYKIIVDRNIFQAVINESDKAKEEVVVEELAPTTLKLSLMGTISGSERDARAIISDDKKNQQDIYQVGDAVQGAFIKTIERGQVVLDVNGRDEVLVLAERKGGGPAYEPSPADFFQEPRQEVEIDSGDDRPDKPGKPEKPDKVDKEERKVRRQPVVRPRPERQEKKQRDEGEGEDVQVPDMPPPEEDT